MILSCEGSKLLGGTVEGDIFSGGIVTASETFVAEGD